MPTGKISGKAVNFRDKAGMNGTILGTLNSGTPLEVLEESGEWLKVAVTGYVSKKLVAKDKTPATPVPPWAEPTPSTPTPVTPPPTVIDSGFLWQNSGLQSLTLEPPTLLKASGTAAQKKLITTFNQYGNLLTQLSTALGMAIGVGLAVMAVESGGVGFKDSKMIIRFEPHWFHKLWGKNNQTSFNQYFKFTSWKGETHFYRTSPTGSWQSFHGNQAKEWEVFDLASSLNDEIAKQSISMGLGQIMGFNHAQVGYASAAEMFEKFNSDVRYHILGMFDFMTPAMKAALAKKDYVTFAKAYNGTGQARHVWKIDCG